jgi:hypothetical protein
MLEELWPENAKERLRFILKTGREVYKIPDKDYPVVLDLFGYALPQGYAVLDHRVIYIASVKMAGSGRVRYLASCNADALWVLRELGTRVCAVDF